MLCASALSQEPAISDAMAQARQSLSKGLNGMRPNLLLAFVSHHYRDEYEQVPELAQALFSPDVFIGCSAGGVIGAGVEVENRPAVSLMAACLPGVTLRPFQVTSGLPSPDAEPDVWAEVLGVPREPSTHFLLLLAGPFEFDPKDLLMGLDFAYPEGVKLGGIASAPLENALFQNREVISSGAIGLALQGNLNVETVVAQGCRPIGSPLTITKCDGDLLVEVDGKPALEILTKLYQMSPPRDQALITTSLHLGIASTELLDDFKQGDFLIRNVVGVDHEQGSLAILDWLRTGQTVQFHVRDAQTASEDLHLMLSHYLESHPDSSPAGALLFTCNGRGEHLFGRANHDSEAFETALGKIPMGGFFCAGEIGPVARSTHVHGFTSAFGILMPMSERTLDRGDSQ